MLKKLLLSCVVLAIFAVLSVNYSCKKDKSDSLEAKSLLASQNGTYVGEAFPSANGTDANRPSISSISGNSSVINGGSLPLTISATDSQNDIQQILVGIKGVDGYYTSNVNTKKSTSSFIFFTLIFTQELTEDFVIIIALRDGGGNICTAYELPVKIVEVATGDLQVSMSWDRLNDVDLHLQQPNGTEIYYGNTYGIEGTFDWDAFDLWFYEKYTEEQIENMDDNDFYEKVLEYAKAKDIPFSGGFLDLDSNAGCGIDSINNENITYAAASSLKTGEYIVRVDFYSGCDVPDKTRYTVTTRYKGEIIGVSSGTNPASGIFEVGTSDGGSAGSGVEVMRFKINSTKKAQIAQIEYPSINKNKKLSTRALSLAERYNKAKGK